jgi:hypothetical protein
MSTKPGTHRHGQKPRRESAAGGQSRDSAVALVHRRCVVCEWEGDGVEPAVRPEATPTCPWCHAPTERVSLDGIRIAAADEANGKNPHAAALGRLGGLKGGVARAAALTPKERRDIATKAARTRWKKKEH